MEKLKTKYNSILKNIYHNDDGNGYILEFANGYGYDYGAGDIGHTYLAETLKEAEEILKEIGW